MSEQDKKNTMTSDTPNVINNYRNLIKQLSDEKQRLNDKNKNTYWLRYVFRRTPLFLGAGLTFFVTCLLMTMTKEFDLKSMNSLLNNLITPNIKEHPFISLAIYTFLVIAFIILMLKPFKTALGEKAGHKTAYYATTSSLCAAMFFTIIDSEHPLFLGLAVFSTLTLFNLLIDRILGFTRRNERYQLFAGRAEDLCVLFASREKLGIKFQESHLLELAKFYEELRQSKYNDTVADSHYLLTLVEQLKAPSK